MTATVKSIWGKSIYCEENKDNFKKLLKNAGWKDKDIDLAWNDGVSKSKTDTKSETVSVSEPLISQVVEPGSPSSKVTKAGRLYQFSTRERASGEVIFGNVFEIGYQRESDDLIVIRKKLWSEINQYEKDRETFKKEYATNELIDKAIENIKNLYIWKLEPITEKGITYIRKIKLCNAEDLLKTYEGASNAKKSK